MEWLPQSLDLNCIENIWGIVKQKLYQGGKQYSSKEELRQQITVISNITPSTIQSLTTSMEKRLIKVLTAKGAHIGMGTERLLGRLDLCNIKEY